MPGCTNKHCKRVLSWLLTAEELGLFCARLSFIFHLGAKRENFRKDGASLLRVNRSIVALIANQVLLESQNLQTLRNACPVSMREGSVSVTSNIPILALSILHRNFQHLYHAIVRIFRFPFCFSYTVLFTRMSPFPPFPALLAIVVP